MTTNKTQAELQEEFRVEIRRELARRDAKGKPEPGKLYLALFHGREDPHEDMDDWGPTGPFIGPLSAAHITYLSSINLIFEDGYETGPLFSRDGLGFYKDLLYYDEVYYGDWELQIAD